MADLRTQKTYKSLKDAFLELLEKYRLNKIAARWPAKAGAQFYFY